MSGTETEQPPGAAEDSRLVIEFAFPADTPDEVVITFVEQFASAVDDLYRGLGGSGLKVVLDPELEGGSA